jgi:hypothetical protein
MGWPGGSTATRDGASTGGYFEDGKGKQACARCCCWCPPGSPTIDCRAAKEARCCRAPGIACDPIAIGKAGLVNRDEGVRLLLVKWNTGKVGG